MTAAGTGRRGAGFGNEVLAWGKAWVAAEALGLRLLAPRWLLNRYRVGDQLGIGRGRMLRAELSARLLPAQEVTEALYRSSGRIDFGEAVRAAREAGRLDGARVLVTSGMWGGYAAIARSRPFLRDRVLGVRGASELVTSVTRHGPVTVGLHVRRGDFGALAPEPGTFNRPVPTAWFAAVVRSLQDQLPGATYAVCTDAADGELPELTALPGVRLVRGSGPATSIQELAVLASCDLLVCSVSSFSLLAAFLSDRPYLWYGPQLTRADGCLTIWGDEPAQRAEGSPTREALAVSDDALAPRGLPVGPDGDVTIGSLETPGDGWDRRRDLLYYGAVPSAPEGGGPT